MFSDTAELAGTPVEMLISPSMQDRRLTDTTLLNRLNLIQHCSLILPWLMLPVFNYSHCPIITKVACFVICLVNLDILVGCDPETSILP